MSSTPAVIRLPHLQVDEGESFLTLGGEPPNIPGANLRGKVGSPCAGIILLGPIDPTELAFALEQAPDPALPIADFGSNHASRRDFVSSHFDVVTFDEMRQAFAPIWLRLAAIPFKAELESRAELTILRLAYSRAAAIAGTFDPDSRQLVKYPMLGTSADGQRSLETLARLDLLHRRHFARTHSCTKCDSARLHVYEACPGCGAANLQEENVVHHYRCGCQEVESHFAQDGLLVCPKCHRSLSHFGVDYGKPGKAVICASCGSTNSEPAVHFVCLDCAAVMPADAATANDWYHYDITDEGVRALREGRLPRFDLAPLLTNRTHAYSPHEFRLLAVHELRVAKRFDRSFSIARIAVANVETLLRQRGAIATDADFRLAVEAMIAELRSSDFVGLGAGGSIVIGFPGTAAKDVDLIIKRIRSSLDATLTSKIELHAEVAEGDAIIELLAGA